MNIENNGYNDFIKFIPFQFTYLIIFLSIFFLTILINLKFFLRILKTTKYFLFINLIFL